MTDASAFTSRATLGVTGEAAATGAPAPARVAVHEAGHVITARILEPGEVARVLKSFSDEQARTAFLTLVLTGVRRSELQALRWRDVDLVDDVLRVRDSKSEDGVRSIAISPKLAEALWQHRRRSHFQGDDERVFCHPERGTVYRAETFQEEFNAALKLAGINDRVRPFHDLRHTSITNDAAAGANPIALMTKAGHSNMDTTKTYLHVAGTVFRDEADRLEARLLGEPENLVPNLVPTQANLARS